MNDRAREALVEAAMRDQKQIFGKIADGKGGLCAAGVLNYASGALWNIWAIARWAGINPDKKAICELCDRLEPSELALMAHLNDFHKLDFLTIARKMP